MVYILNDNMYSRMDILAKLHHFLLNHYKLCPWGLRVSTEFDFTGAFLMWHMTRYTLLPNLWRLHLSYIIHYHHNIQVLFASKDKKWNVSLKVIFMFSCLCSLWHIYRDGYRYVAVLQECLELLSWFMNNGQFPFLLYASRIFHDKKIESTVKRKLSLRTFLWSYGRTFIFGQSCVGNDTQCVCQGQLNQIFKNLFGMITEWSPTFSPKLSNNIGSLR
jgi:hypothetical protein